MKAPEVYAMLKEEDIKVLLEINKKLYSRFKTKLKSSIISHIQLLEAILRETKK